MAFNMEITISNLVDHLINKIPNIVPYIKSEGDYIEGLPHMIFSIVFVQYLIRSYHEPLMRDEFLKCVSFMNEMINGDEDVKEILSVSIIEEILQERDMVKERMKQIKRR